LELPSIGFRSSIHCDVYSSDVHRSIKYPTYLQEEYNTVGKSYGTKGRCEPISLEGARKVHTIHGGINGYHDESAHLLLAEEAFDFMIVLTCFLAAVMG